MRLRDTHQNMGDKETHTKTQETKRHAPKHRRLRDTPKTQETKRHAPKHGRLRHTPKHRRLRDPHQNTGD